MKALKECLERLLKDDIDEALSVQLITHLAGLSTEEAQSWITAFGDPLVNSKASGLVCVMSGLDDQSIWTICREDARDEQELARLVIRLTVEIYLDAQRQDKMSIPQITGS